LAAGLGADEVCLGCGALAVDDFCAIRAAVAIPCANRSVAELFGLDD